jgi:Na+(H+)/acetate symporter ActP
MFRCKIKPDPCINISEAHLLKGTYKVAMTSPELAKLIKYLKNSSFYFEFGCGGSTKLVANMFTKLMIHSVDSSKDWIENVIKNSTVIQEGIKVNRITFHWIDIGSFVITLLQMKRLKHLLKCF